MTTRWSVSLAKPWILERIEESHFLFNPRSSETHVLNDLAVETLEMLHDAPATPEELLGRLGIGEPPEAMAGAMDPAEPFRLLLRELDRLGLITPEPS